MSPEQKDDATLNIGALSMATGVPVETIRTWERRYGFPKSQRNEAGHRIYELETIEHLRLVTTMLSRGYRPSQLEDRSRRELEELVDKTAPDVEEDDAPLPSTPVGAGSVGDEWCEAWLETLAKLDREAFVGLLRCEFSRMPALEFLQRRVGPFLLTVGEGWAQGRVSVAQEHFASECVGDFLASKWRAMTRSASGPSVVLASLPGEQHFLGLHMAALVAAMVDRRVVFLGANTPVADIEEASRRTDADVIASSISENTDPDEAVRFLADLRQRVDEEIDIIVGGTGAPRDMSGIEVMDDFRQFCRRLS